MEIETGVRIPDPKEKIRLYLSAGKRSITASRYSRLNVCFSIEASERIIDHHGTALTSISRSSDQFSLWDTHGKGQEVCKSSFSSELPRDLAVIVSTANELLMHSIPRMAKEFSAEYDVEIVAPLFIQAGSGRYGEPKTLAVAGLDLGSEECEQIERAFEEIRNHGDLLFLLMKNATLAQWVKVAVDDHWSREDWDLAVETAGMNGDPDFSEGWAAVELVTKFHALETSRYGGRWKTRIPEGADISADANWTTADDFITSLASIRPGWDDSFDLGSSTGPWTFPIEMVNAAMSIGLSRAKAASLGLELSDTELLVMGTAEFTLKSNGDLALSSRAYRFSDRSSSRDKIALHLGAMMEAKLKTQERPAIHPPEPDDIIFSDEDEKPRKATRLARHAHLARATIVQYGAQTAQRELLTRIKQGDIPKAKARGALPLDHPVWTLLAAKAHNEHSRRALENLADAGCVLASSTTPGGASLLDFAIANGGPDSIDEAVKLGSKSKNLLEKSMKSGNPAAAVALLEKEWEGTVKNRQSEALALAREAGGEVHARFSLAAAKDDLDHTFLANQGVEKPIKKSKPKVR